MKIKDLIAEDMDIDVYDDYDERCGMAVCGPVNLTEKGRAVFGRALDLECEVHDFKGHPYGFHAVAHCETEKEAELLHHFLLAAAGYVGDDLYREWFSEV